MVYAGPIFWDAAKHGKAVLTTYRDFISAAPEELGFFVGLKTVPSVDAFPKEGWGKRACAIIGSYNGPQADGERAARVKASDDCATVALRFMSRGREPRRGRPRRRRRLMLAILTEIGVFDGCVQRKSAQASEARGSLVSPRPLLSPIVPRS